MLFLAYPKSDYDEPEGALASYIEVLSGYSDQIIGHVTSNKTGIQRKSKFPPRVAELVSACDEAAQHFDRISRFENWGKGTDLQIEGPKEDKPTIEQLHAKYGKDWGLTSLESAKTPTRPAPTWDEIAKSYSADPSRIAALVSRE